MNRAAGRAGTPPPPGPTLNTARRALPPSPSAAPVFSGGRRALPPLFRRKPLERPGFLLYSAAVAAARDPWFFEEPIGVPDTLDGRFDLIGLHVGLLIRRLHPDPDPRGAEAAQAVFDAMFADMDVNLREMGVGDMSVGKRVKRMWEAFHGRARAYEAALDAGDRAALETAIARNVFRSDPGDAAAHPGAAVLA